MERRLQAVYCGLAVSVVRMRAFFLRFSALAIRFLCPLAALALSNAETMGRYYLFISYFTFVVGLSALELAVPFSRKFLRCKGNRQSQLIFSDFLNNQVVVSTALAVPAGILVSSWAGVPAVLIPLFCLSLATEACVNEVGRFFWNIGEWQVPSLRDFLRAVIFSVAIVGSIYFENEVLTAMTFLIIAAGNLFILYWEWMSWGTGCLPSRFDATRLISRAWNRGNRSLKTALPQFVQMQLLGLQPLLERVLVEKSLGLAVVGAYAFCLTVMQAGAGLLLLPWIAKTRKVLLGVYKVADVIVAYRQMLMLLINILLVSGVCALVTYFAVPLMQLVLVKSVPATLFLMIIAFISMVSATFCSAIAPFFTMRNAAWASNGLTLFGLLPLLGAQWLYPKVALDNLSLMVIGVVATLQMAGRLIYISRDMNRLTLGK